MAREEKTLMVRSDLLEAQLSRRGLLKRTAAIGLAAPLGMGLLAACGSDDDEEPAEEEDSEPTAADTEPTEADSEPTEEEATGGSGDETTPEATEAGSEPTSSDSGSAEGEGKQGGSVTWALTSDPVNLIPFGGVSTSNMWGKEFMYDSLLEWDQELTVQPALAESFEVSDDATVYTFSLRPGVVFHNGKELTTDDVVYSFEMAVDPPEPGVQLSYLESLKTATFEAVDESTVVVTLESPDPTIPGVLAWARYTPVVPEGVYDEINVLSEGIGTGPYQLVEFIGNDRVVFERFPDFWKEGLPYIDNLTLKVLPDEQSRVAAVRSGEIDGGSFTPDAVLTLEKDDSLQVLEGLVGAPRVIQFVIHGDEPWADVKVRQAINFAVDRQQIIDNVYAGDAVMSAAIPPGYGDWFIPEDELKETYYKHDVEQAKALMAEAGFEDGFDVTLEAIADPREYTQIAEIIKSQLEDININVTVQPLEIGQFAANNGAGEYQWQSTGRGMRGDPSGYVVDFRPPASLFDVWFGGGWESEELTQLYEEALQTSDSELRHTNYRRIQEIIAEEVPNMYTVQNKKFHVVQNRLKNMYLSYTDFHTGLRYAWVEEE